MIATNQSKFQTVRYQFRRGFLTEYEAIKILERYWNDSNTFTSEELEVYNDAAEWFGFDTLAYMLEDGVEELRRRTKEIADAAYQEWEDAQCVNVYDYIG